jgi:hypothetical protein
MISFSLFLMLTALSLMCLMMSMMPREQIWAALALGVKR